MLNNTTFWYPGDGNTKEIVGNGNNGTIQGNVGFAIGKVGQAFTFGGHGDTSGNGDRVLVGNPLGMQIQDFTIDAWIKRASSSIVSNDVSPCCPGAIFFAYGTGGYGFGIDQATGKILLTKVDSSEVLSTGTVTDTNYHHVAVTKSGSTITFYIDGVPDAPVSYNPGFTFTTNAAIGARGDNDVRNAFFGDIDELQISNRAFTQTEIQSIVAAGTSGMCKGNATGGGAVQLQAGDATVIFNNSASNGRVDYQTLDTYQPGPMPFGYNSPLEVADVSTTVTFTGTTRVCFNLQSSQFDVPFTQLRILHLEGNDLVNRTSLSQPATRTLCADVTSFSPFVIAQSTTAPTSASLTLSGRVVDAGGAPLPGVIVELSGAKRGRTITDADGRFRFESLTAGEFYSLRPELANFSFSPQTRSLSLTGDFADATFTASANPLVIANPVDTDMYFVRQQYLDFLGREPDEGGLQYWTSRISECGTDADCIRQRRIDVSAAYFMSDEFQETGSFVYRLYKASYGLMPTYQQFTADRSKVAGGDSLEARKAAFLDEWVARTTFKQAYPDTLTPENFVLRVMSYMGYPPRTGDWESYVLMLKSGSTRAQVLGRIIDDVGFRQREYNRAFVMMQYFGYLRRDADTGGFNFWLDVLENRVPSNYRSMVCAFLTSTEYQRRFSSVVTRSNSECTQ